MNKLYVVHIFRISLQFAKISNDHNKLGDWLVEEDIYKYVRNPEGGWGCGSMWQDQLCKFRGSLQPSDPALGQQVRVDGLDVTTMPGHLYPPLHNYPHIYQPDHLVVHQ